MKSKINFFEHGYEIEFSENGHKRKYRYKRTERNIDIYKEIADKCKIQIFTSQILQDDLEQELLNKMYSKRLQFGEGSDEQIIHDAISYLTKIISRTYKAAEILIKEGYSDSAEGLMRTIVEALVDLDYILVEKEEQVKRAKIYLEENYSNKGFNNRNNETNNNLYEFYKRGCNQIHANKKAIDRINDKRSNTPECAESKAITKFCDTSYNRLIAFYLYSLIIMIHYLDINMVLTIDIPKDIYEETENLLKGKPYAFERWKL